MSHRELTREAIKTQMALYGTEQCDEIGLASNILLECVKEAWPQEAPESVMRLLRVAREATHALGLEMTRW